MKKFEYKKETIPNHQLSEDYLNKLGNEGWELIQIITSVNIVFPEDRGTHVHIFSKREKKSQNA